MRANYALDLEKTTYEKTAYPIYLVEINSLDKDLRDAKSWSYLLLGETQFYSIQKSSADIDDIANSTKMNESSLSGNLFDML